MQAERTGTPRDPLTTPAVATTPAPSFLIADVTTLTDVPASQLRSWEQAGLLHPRRSAGSIRVYGSEDVARVRLIKRSLVNPGRRGSLRRLAAQLTSGGLRPEPQDYAGLEAAQTPSREAPAVGGRVPWQSVVESLADLVAVCDEQGTLLYLNPALQAALLPSAADPRPWPEIPMAAGAGGIASNLFASGDLSMHWTARTGVSQQDIPVTLVHPDGTEHQTLWNITPLRDAQGTLRGAVAIGRDITTERALAQTREDWLAAAVHDLRNSVTTILGTLQLARRSAAAWTQEVAPASAPSRRAAGQAAPASADMTPVARLTRHLEVAETGTRDLVTYMETLLDASAAAAGGLLRQLEPAGVDLGALTRLAVGHAQTRTTRHRVLLELPPEPLVVTGDAARLRQMLDNLLVNAVKYAPDGGPISVRLEVVAALPAPPLATPLAAAPRDPPVWALLRVADAGLGIPAADVPHVFERYRRAAGAARLVPGTGLGLYTCRAIVAAHGGHIWVERTAVMAEPAGPRTGAGEQ